MCFASLETLLPKKQRVQTRAKRWFSNLAIIVIDSITLRLMGQLSGLTAAFHAAEQGWGVFNGLNLPQGLELILALVLLDLAIYAQHIAFHKIPLLWRLHRVHHADRDLDVTTGVRFHPLEIILSILYKYLIIILIGPTFFAVFLFEILLNTTAMFNHSNTSLKPWFDKTLRSVIVTPDMHRIHHSIINTETDSNYGFCLSIWDKLFKTYKKQPKQGHDNMVLGLKEYQSDKPSNLLWCLRLPFSK